MPTIWDAATRADLTARAQTLTPAHRARWGAFTVVGMMAHLNDALLMVLGDLEVKAKAPAFLRLAPIRYLLLHVLPMPKRAPTAPELLARSNASDLGGEQATFVALLARLGDTTTLAPTHPVFGSMTRADWGVLIHKHTDHHLRQFGA